MKRQTPRKAFHIGLCAAFSVLQTVLQKNEIGSAIGICDIWKCNFKCNFAQIKCKSAESILPSGSFRPTEVPAHFVAEPNWHKKRGTGPWLTLRYNINSQSWFRPRDWRLRTSPTSTIPCRPWKGNVVNLRNFFISVFCANSQFDETFLNSQADLSNTCRPWKGRCPEQGQRGSQKQMQCLKKWVNFHKPLCRYATSFSPKTGTPLSASLTFPLTGE